MLWVDAKKISGDSRDSLLFVSSLWPIEVTSKKHAVGPRREN